MADDPWGPFDRLREAIQEALPKGVRLEHWVIMPGGPGENRGAQVIFSISPEAFAEPEPEETPEAKATREQFESMMASERVFEDQSRAQSAIQGLLKIRRDGILDDDDAPEA